MAIRGDVADSGFCFDAAGRVQERPRPIDVLVHNAGIQAPIGMFEQLHRLARGTRDPSTGMAPDEAVTAG